MLYAGSILQSYMQEGRESMVFINFIFPILLGFFYPPYRYRTVLYRTVRYQYRYRTVPYRTVRYGTNLFIYVLTATVNPFSDIEYTEK